MAIKGKSTKKSAKKVAVVKKTTTAKAKPKKVAVVKKATVAKPKPKKVAVVKKTTTAKAKPKKAAVVKKTTRSKKKAKSVEKILVAIDGTVASQKAVDYLAKLGILLKTCELTLFHVLPSIPPEMLEDGGSEDPIIERFLKEERDEEIDKWEKGLKFRSKKVFEESKKKLIAGGVPADRIKIKIGLRSPDIGKDIVETAKKGGFATIVVGRRGVSFLQELALGSISYRVVKLAKDCTVWVVH